MLGTKARWAVAFALTTLLGCAVLGLTQDWLGKPFGQWSKAEAEQLLHDSPWARS